jgi:Fur family zinc uptake transcriptional regulator
MSIGFESHDHSTCISTSIKAVDSFCATKGLQLTPVRRRVMEILLEQHKALGAYEILDILRKEGLGSQPPVVYRALDFLLNNGFAHKIERTNAFTACMHVGVDHAPAFLICRTCEAVVETESILSKDLLRNAAQKMEFQIERVVLEAEGLCPRCQEPEEE